MKKTLLCTVLFLAVSLTALAGCGNYEPPAHFGGNSGASSQSGSSSGPDLFSDTSEKQKSSAESPDEPSQEPEPSEDLTPEKRWSEEEINTLLGDSGSHTFSVSYSGEEQTQRDDVSLNTAELTYSGDTDDIANILEELSSYENNSLYLTYFSLDKTYDTFSAKLRLENPYSNEEQSNHDAKEYIAQRWDSIDRKALMEAFVGENLDFSLQTAEGTLFKSENGMVKIQVGIDFRTYDGFVTYQYKMINADKFSFEGDLSAKQKEDEDDPMPFHTDTVLVTDKFNK